MNSDPPPGYTGCTCCLEAAGKLEYVQISNSSAAIRSFSATSRASSTDMVADSPGFWNFEYNAVIRWDCPPATSDWSIARML
ncbi:hypothetical protein [Streptomyces sp. PA5.6]|uniref:hypothetical protein n=1 Tax=Streptomyces sp. PA5.6 TaxID=3035651 RepID=UPI003904B108